MYIIIPINLYIFKRWKKNELPIIKSIFITIIISHKDNNEKMWSNKELQVSNTKCEIKFLQTSQHLIHRTLNLNSYKSLIMSI